jgi:iron(III) transport system permease protein
LVDHWIFAPWAALTIRSLPPSLLILWYAFRTIPPAILDAAEMDGASAAARFWRIALPSRISAVLLAWLVAFAVAMGDLAASILVVPPGVTTLSIHLFGLLHYGVQDKVAGACLALLAVFATIAAGIFGLVWRWNREASSRNDQPAGSIME